MCFFKYEQVLSQALDLYLEACDPVRKAQRIEKKKSQKTKKPETKDQHVESSKVQESPQPVLRPSHIDKIRKSIPAAIKNAVLLRDKGRCTHVDTSGSFHHDLAHQLDLFT